MDMDDKELMTAAAKAAGIRIDRWHGNAGDYWTGRDVDDKERNPGLWIRWNPLNDDADALRLAVRLQIDLRQNERSCIAEYGDGWSLAALEEPYASDPCEATRRAIVRAAAVLGAVTPNAEITGG